MSHVKFTQDQRAAFLKAVRGAAGYRDAIAARGWTSDKMQLFQYLEIASSLGVDPMTYGTPRRPAVRTVRYDSLTTSLAGVITRMSEGDSRYVRSVAEDAARHDGMISEAQAATLRRIIARYEDAPAPAPVPAPAPLPVTVPAPEPVSTPVPAPAVIATPAPVTGAAGQLAQLIETILQGGGATSEARVIELIKQHGGSPAHVTVDLRLPAMPDSTPETRLMHHREPLLLSAVSAGVPVFLVGPAGSGKTTAAANIAKALGKPFEFTGALSAEYKLSGFVDAQGRVVCTAFRRAYEHGGVFLFDEIDGSNPGAVLAFNAALANDSADFPDGQVARHPDFRVIAAGNTFGRGASRQYVGRTQLDAASLDRFATLTWDYDPALESALVGLPRPDNAPLPASISPLTSDEAVRQIASRWLDRVREVRAKIEEKAIRHVVSPRATIFGTRLLAAGWPWPEVEEGVIFKGMDLDTRAKLSA